MIRLCRLLPSLLVASCLTAAPLAAQEKKPAKPSEAEMMAKWMAAATPGKEHEFLKKYEGKWKCQTKAWFSGPDSAPLDSTGSSSSKLVLGGRFILDEHDGMMMGMPFKGMGMTGYDNIKKKFVGTWCDNMGTCLLTMHGSLDATGKVLTMHGTMDDVVTGEHDKQFKYVTRWQSDDKYVFEIYEISDSDKKIMEMTCTREK